LHTHSRIWIHLVWTTKRREPILNKEIRIRLFDFLIGKGKTIEMPFEKLNIQPEHVHALIDLPTNKTVAEFMQLIKGSSSHMLNQDIFKAKFNWQRGYGAYSVSSLQLDVVRNYIANQSKHHQKTAFANEYEAWKREYGVIDDM